MFQISETRFFRISTFLTWSCRFLHLNYLLQLAFYIILCNRSVEASSSEKMTKLCTKKLHFETPLGFFRHPRNNGKIENCPGPKRSKSAQRCHKWFWLGHFSIFQMFLGLQKDAEGVYKLELFNTKLSVFLIKLESNISVFDNFFVFFFCITGWIIFELILQLNAAKSL